MPAALHPEEGIAILNEIERLAAGLSDETVRQLLAPATAQAIGAIANAKLERVGLNPQPLPPGPDDAFAVHPEPQVHGSV